MSPIKCFVICSAEPRGFCGDPRIFGDLTKVPQVFRNPGGSPALQDERPSRCTTIFSRLLGKRFFPAAPGKAPSEPCPHGAALTSVHSIALAVPLHDIGKPFVSFIFCARLEKCCAMLPQCCDKIADPAAQLRIILWKSRAMAAPVNPIASVIRARVTNEITVPRPGRGAPAAAL